MNRLLQTLPLLLLSAGAQAQIGIGTTTPDAKAALDIQAVNKGLLIPRLTAAQRTAIGSPPQGLMVYQTDGSASGGPQTGFWYYAGSPAQWVFLDPAPGTSTLTLPYIGVVTGANDVGFWVNANGADGTGLRGQGTAGGTGVLGTSTSGDGVRGVSIGTGGGVGIEGTAGTGTGVRAGSGSGVALQAAKVAAGPGQPAQTGRVAELINGNSANDSTAVHISTAGDRPALRAVNTATSGQAAIRGVKQAAAPDGVGVEGVITSGASGNAAGVLGQDESGSNSGSGVIGLTAGGYGVRGIASANGGYGVSGSATNSYGVIGSSQTGTGVFGSSSAPGNAGAAAVLGSNASGLGVGVRGTVTGGVAVVGENTGAGDGVSGRATSGSGITGRSTSGSGVYGETAAASGGPAGVEGISSNSTGVGVLGTTTSGYGVRGEATGSSGYGVTGVASGSNGIGVFGNASGAAMGLTGQASGTGRAGYFNQTNAASTTPAVEIVKNGGGPALRISGDVTTPATGAANMLPVAYGKIDYDGSIITGSGNFSVAHTPNTDTYIITLTSADLAATSMNDLVSVVSLSSTLSGARCTINTRNGTSINNNIGTFAVDIRNANMASVVVPEERFSFMLFKP